MKSRRVMKTPEDTNRLRAQAESFYDLWKRDKAAKEAMTPEQKAREDQRMSELAKL